MTRRLIFPLLLGLVGAAVLVALGVWQLQRLAWKEGVLADIEARIAAAPVALPEGPQEAAHRYLPVAVSGRFLPGEIHILGSVKGAGPGFRVIAPFETEAGRRILVDRGFIREAEKDTPRPPGAARLAGNLHWPDDRTSSTPAPDLGRNIWFSRDVAAMAAALGTEPVLLTLRDAEPAAPAILPQPVTSAGIPNDHLEYAVTWFSLALVWLGMTAFLIRRITRSRG